MTMKVDIVGLDEFMASVDRARGDVPDMVRMVQLDVADRIVTGAKGNVKSKTGAAKGSIRVRQVGPQRIEVTGGGSRAPYFGWLDFGGTVGVNDSVVRPYRRRGRFIWFEYFDLELGGDIEDTMDEELADILRRAGLDVRS